MGFNFIDHVWCVLTLSTKVWYVSILTNKKVFHFNRPSQDIFQFSRLGRPIILKCLFVRPSSSMFRIFDRVDRNLRKLLWSTQRRNDSIFSTGSMEFFFLKSVCSTQFRYVSTFSAGVIDTFKNLVHSTQFGYESNYSRNKPKSSTKYLQKYPPWYLVTSRHLQ